MSELDPRTFQAEGAAAESLQETLLGSSDIGEFLTEFAGVLCHNLSRAGIQAWCTVTLLRARKPTTVALSDPRARVLDEMQYQHSQGPCLRAAATGMVVYNSDTGNDSRWSTYARALAERGVGSLLAVPLGLEGEGKAALNAYAAHSYAFDEPTRGIVQDQVALLAPALRLAVRMAGYRETEEHLNAALESRTTINLAVGIIMGQSRCSQDEAFRILASAASNRNVKLRDLAAHLVARVSHGPVTTHFDY